jgi:uncharacterized protein YebE (UPF0316 family)
MFSQEFLDSTLFQWVLLPFLIFLARMSDVTLATLRNIFLSKSIKYIVPFIGFVEVMIWLLAISQIMKNLQNPVCFLAYAFGYSMGIVVGIKIEERLALGLQIMRIILPADESASLTEALIKENYGITLIEGSGSKGPVTIILAVVKRKEIPLVQQLINNVHPNTFYSIEDIRGANSGIFRKDSANGLAHLKRIFPSSSQK